MQQEAALRKRLEQSPADHHAWHALGLIYLNAGKIDLAIHCLEQAISVDSSVAIYHRNIGEIYRRAGSLVNAIKAGERACALAPRDVDAHYNLGLAQIDAKDFTQAGITYRKALALNPRHNLSWNNLGAALDQMGDKKGALQAYENAIQIAPKHAEAQNNAGAIYFEEGRLDKARHAFEAAIQARPHFIDAHFNLSSLKTYQLNDPHIKILQALYEQRGTLTGPERIKYDFALGKALEDIGKYDEAFAAYDEGNRIQHALLPYDETRADALLKEILSIFSREFFAERSSWQGVSDFDRTPIFIVGMPRSGTTLLEQILCSHEAIHGAGELMDLNAVVMRATSEDSERPFTQHVRCLSESDIRQIGEQYLQRVWSRSPESDFITDKMPANFFYLGLIHLALPRAKIIHATRDPMDSCFSCFARLFHETMEFAYDQGTLGRYYVRYMTLMKHWKEVLPDGVILDLHYEQLVEDIEGQARRVLDFIGLPWDASCLDFYKNDRPVRTASAAQVRKPIYKNSVARWRHFAKFLTPLLSIVRDYRQMTPEDEAVLTSAPHLATHPGETASKQIAQNLHLQAIALYQANRFDEALALADQALAIVPEFSACLNSRGFVLQDMGRMHDALDSFAKAVALSPEMDIARLNLGLAQLKMGDWENGWNNYEARWTGSAEAGTGQLKRLDCPAPLWIGQGESKSRSLLVITEQGFGDTFQFVRYLPLAVEKFGKVGFVCSQPTQRLIEWALGDRIVTFTRMPDASCGYDTWDFHCPLMSLPRAFGTRPDSIPNRVPYLQVPAPAQEHWKSRLDKAAPKRVRIGVAWAGRKAHRYDRRRSLETDQLRPLFECDDITWVSLQKWAPEDQRPDIAANVHWIDWTEELSDFADTAALINCLDLVITIDSAMVHLAGALNRPVWLLDRFDSEWRWLHNRLDSPWYPSVRIFRQPAFGQWSEVIERVQRELATLHDQLGIAKPSETKQLAQSVKSQKKDIHQSNPDKRTVATSTDEVSLSIAIQRAAQFQAAGRLQESEQLLLQILETQPANAHALHLLGITYYRAGQVQLGMDRVAKAIQLAPHIGQFYSNLAEMNRQQGKVSEAIALGEQAVRLAPSMASSHSNLGLAYYDAKEFERARACHQNALKLSPGLLHSLNNLGSISRALKQTREAEGWYRKAIALDPDYFDSLSNLGAVLVENDRPDEAVVFLEKALRIAPNQPDALCNLGLARLKQELVSQAIDLLSRSLQLRTVYPQAMIGLAVAMQKTDNLEKARQLLLEAVKHTPEKADAWCQLGRIHLELSEISEAEKAFTIAIELDPETTDALIGLGNLRLEQGEMDESISLFERAIATDSENIGARFHLIQARKVLPDDANVKSLEKVLARKNERQTDECIALHYALGKAYDDLKEWDRAFEHFLEGARLKRSTFDYNADHEAARVERLMNIVDASFIQRFSGSGNPTDIPVFVLGMPRSGTTLTEQIIASHPSVHGAGELPHLMAIVHQNPDDDSLAAFPDNLTRLTEETLMRWGTDYSKRLQNHHKDARRITDKMPVNYLGLGLIPLMLPQARIIHVRRDPVDTCVSCFTRLFNRDQQATYDLYELGRHYRNYARLMEHWRRVLPPGSFLDVDYEEIIENQEAQARRLIDWIGLEWNDACVEFHKTKRNIRTASVTQVRQPIYKTSVARWRHYEKFLGPLLDGLGDVLQKS